MYVSEGLESIRWSRGGCVYTAISITVILGVHVYYFMCLKKRSFAEQSQYV